LATSHGAMRSRSRNCKERIETVAAGLGTAEGPAFTPLSAQVKERCECGLDGTCALNLPRPKSREEEEALVKKFLAGVEKLFSKENNWTFLQPLLLTMEHCTRCQTCSDACHIYEASGRNEVYRPLFRSEILRRLYFKYVKHGGLVSRWQHGDIELNWPWWRVLPSFPTDATSAAAAPQTCPIGADNGLVAHETAQDFQHGDGHRGQGNP